MKKIITIFSFLFLTSSVFAQISKGQWLVGGLAEVSYSQLSSPNTSNVANDLAFKLSPDVGYFIFDGFALGLRTNFYREHYEQPAYNIFYNGYKVDVTQFTGSAFLRYYFLPNTSKVNILIDGGFAYGYSDQNTSFTGTNTPNSNWNSSKIQNIFFSAGPVIFLNRNTALEFLVSYNHINNTGNSTYQTGLFFGVGFQIHLGKGKAEDTLRKKPMKPLNN